MDKLLMAVVAGEVSGFAERELLRGIIAENRRRGVNTAVFSGIYNTLQEDAFIECERRIFELVCSQDISGVIVFNESFTEERARVDIACLLRRLNVPFIGIGTAPGVLAQLGMPCLDTDEESELEELTDHLINVHGYTDIIMLTGMPEAQVSHRRVEGFRRSLEKHGIAFRDDMVVFGDFWVTSGRALAESMISGERSFPQAVVCANDCMAFGMLRRFSEAGIRIPEQTAVVAYEYSEHRFFYSPVLTCFWRGHEELGSAGASLLYSLVTGSPEPKFMPPKGRIVCGESCQCHADRDFVLAEQRSASARFEEFDLSLISTMEQRMTVTRDMQELTGVIAGFTWMIRGKRSMYLRLLTDWYDPGAVSGRQMQTRCVMPDRGDEVFEHDRFDLKCLFDREPDSDVCCLAPVLSDGELFGDMAVLYGGADGYSYDDMFRHWLKAVSIGLGFMRLKSGFRYVLSFQNASQECDQLTGLYSAKGLKRAYSALTSEKTPALCCLMLRLFPAHGSGTRALYGRTELMLTVSRAVRRFCGENALAGHISDGMFVCFVKSRGTPGQLSELLSSILLCEKGFIGQAGTDSFACAAAECGTEPYPALLKKCKEQIDRELERIQKVRKTPGYQELLALRDRIYASPELTFAQDRELIPEQKLELIRSRYKKCFGITFHQDCIAARIARARCCLVLTGLDLAEISEECGYMDHKYFQRQFAAGGIPALKYRALFSIE